MSDISGLGEFFCHACTLPDNVGELRQKYFNLSPFEQRRLREVRDAVNRMFEEMGDDPTLAETVRSVVLQGGEGCACDDTHLCMVHGYLLDEARKLAARGETVDAATVEKLWREFLSAP